MISLDAFFWIFVVLFGIVGAMRGWSKELLVTFAVILTLFVINVVESLPIVGPALTKTPEIDFYVRVIMLTILVFFGYQSPSFSRLAGNNRFAREKLQDSLLGFLLGAINAYLFIGTVLFYLQKAFELMGTGKYPIEFILPVDSNTPAGIAYFELLKILPPVWLTGIGIYIAVALAFTFVLIVFI
jgi:uncharacterized membrane protein required for colicin V production